MILLIAIFAVTLAVTSVCVEFFLSFLRWKFGRSFIGEVLFAVIRGAAYTPSLVWGGHALGFAVPLGLGVPFVLVEPMRLHILFHGIPGIVIAAASFIMEIRNRQRM